MTYLNFMDMYYEHYSEHQADNRICTGSKVLPYMLERMDPYKIDALETALQKCRFTRVGEDQDCMIMINVRFKRYYSGCSKAADAEHVGNEIYTLDRFVHEVLNPFGCFGPMGMEKDYVATMIDAINNENKHLRKEKKALVAYAKILNEHPEMTDDFIRIWRQNDRAMAIKKIRHMANENINELDEQDRESILIYAPGERY